MRVRVTFYGRLREVAGGAEREVEVEGDAPTVADVVDRLRAEHPALDGHLDAAAYAVGDRLVDRGDALPDADAALDVLPPVSGG